MRSEDVWALRTAVIFCATTTPSAARARGSRRPARWRPSQPGARRRGARGTARFARVLLLLPTEFAAFDALSLPWSAGASMRRSGLGDSPGNGDDSGSPPATQNVAANIQVTNIVRLADHSAAWHLACTLLPALLPGRRQASCSRARLAT